MTEVKTILHLSPDDILVELKRNIEEIIGEEEIHEKLVDGKTLHVYWGTSPTLCPSFAYFLPLLKIRDMLRLGFQVTILLADVHSYLDNGSSAYSKVEQRTIFYELILKSMLEVLGVNIEQVNFIKGSNYQFDKRYCLDLLKLSSMTKSSVATKASSEVVKREKDPLLSHLLYPLMQALDESYLEADIELCGRDQRKILTFSRDNVEKLGYSKCAYLITPLIPSLKGPGKKMSSSEINGKLSFMDSDEEVFGKVSKAFCADREIDEEKNPLLSILRHIIFPHFGTVDKYSSFESFHNDWNQGSLMAQDLKRIILPYLVKMITPIRNIINLNIALYNEAYE